ncbi:MAG TPA: YafY family protein [Brevibacillus sp.]|nr:YafY family protein [Brevibacillus sp.]
MKLERLMAITIILLNRKRVQAQELAERMEVSLRTIYRDMESLCLAGIPIVSYMGTEGGYEIMDSFRLDRQMLSHDELIAMLTALRGLQSTKALSESSMERLLEKVGALVSQTEQGSLADRDQILVDFTPWRSSEAERKKYEALNHAVKEKKLVTFSYIDHLGQETVRCVEPMGLVLKGYKWYLHGYCLEREDYRIFRLSRIRDLQTQAVTFQRRDMKLEKLNEKWKQLPDRPGPMFDVVLHFSSALKAVVADRFDEDDIERQPDGSLLVRTTMPDQEWLISFLLSFRNEMRVLEPARLAVAVRTAALEIAGLYGDMGKVVAP